MGPGVTSPKRRCHGLLRVSSVGQVPRVDVRPARGEPSAAEMPLIAPGIIGHRIEEARMALMTNNGLGLETSARRLGGRAAHPMLLQGLRSCIT